MGASHSAAVARVPLLLATLLCAAVLSACGQKGPLFLPDESAPVLVTPVQPASDANASPVSVVPPAPAQQSDAQPPAGASQGTDPQAGRTRSSK